MLSRDKRDFGKGFYTTTIFEQAEHWAKNQFIRYGGDGSIVKVFDFDQENELSVLTFDSMNIAWLEFVKENRTNGGITHVYDIVRGPVANDNTMRTIALYISGVYTAEQAVRRLRHSLHRDSLKTVHWTVFACVAGRSLRGDFPPQYL